MNFMDLIVTFIWAFVFIAYLMILFSIFSDLFSDHSIGGGVKALWVILLIVTWWLGALIYLIVRGGGMAARQQARLQAAKAQTDAYIKDVAGNSQADELAKAAALKKSGTITDAEFTALKKKILAGK